jgi:hypothetical protein
MSILPVACAPKAVPTPEVINPDTPSSTAVPADARVVDIEETDSGFEVIEVSRIPARNCVGQNIIRFSESLSRSTTQEITLGGSISAGIATIVIVSLEAEYRVTNGEEIEKTVEFEVEAKPGSYLEYQVVWKEVWAKGYVVLESADGTQMRIPYNITHSLRGGLVDPVDIGCD